MTPLAAYCCGNTPPGNWALQMPWQLHVGAAVVLALIVVVLRLAWRRREARRTHTRYRFNDRGKLVGSSGPPPPHAYCSAFMCLRPEAGPCSAGRSQSEQ